MAGLKSKEKEGLKRNGIWHEEILFLWCSFDSVSTPVGPALWPLSPALTTPSARCVAGHSRHVWFVFALLELDRKSIVFHLQTIAFIVFLSISPEPFWLGAFSPGFVETLFIFWNGFFIFWNFSLYFGIDCKTRLTEKSCYFHFCEDLPWTIVKKFLVFFAED